jgi:hypothetical protein
VRLYLLVVLIGAAADVFPILLSSILGDGASIVSVFGVSRNSLYAHVLGFFPRNILYYPVVTALIIGTMISEDRLNGTSALYFQARLCNDEVPRRRLRPRPAVHRHVAAVLLR